MSTAEHDHHHHHVHGGTSEPKLIFSILLNLLISLAEVAGGLLSGSIALLSDALHNISDTFSLIASFVGVRLAKKQKTELMTFGYKRAEVLIALFNASLLLVSALYLFKEAFERLAKPVSINGPLMIGVGLIGLLANVLSVVLLRKDAEHSLNIRSAYTHLIMDALSSVAVVLGAILVMFFRMYWIDGIFSVLISTYVLIGGYRILWESIGILMHNVPDSINLKKIQRDVLAIKGIIDIHHVHAWRLTDEDIHFEAHINVNKRITMPQINSILCTIEQLLATKHGINHTTIQIEHGLCKNPRLVNK
jgi:cobalt-zinc-cadmium efflux system protein